MKKTLLSLTILFFAALNSFAQSDNTNTKIGVGFDIGVVTGASSSLYGETGGVLFKLEQPIAAPFSVTLTTGYTGYITKGGFSTGYNSTDGSYTYGSIASFVPVELGAKVYLSEKFYVEGDLGASFNLSSDASIPTKKMALMYAPNVGYTIPFGGSKISVDVSIKYEGRLETGSPYSQVAACAVFNFGL